MTPPTEPSVTEHPLVRYRTLLKSGAAVSDTAGYWIPWPTVWVTVEDPQRPAEPEH
jgi:hypothetical protein